MILLLTRRIPDLHCHDNVIDLDLALLKVRTDRRLGVLRIGFLAERIPVQERSLADVRVADDHNLEEVLLLH